METGITKHVQELDTSWVYDLQILGWIFFCSVVILFVFVPSNITGNLAEIWHGKCLPLNTEKIEYFIPDYILFMFTLFGIKPCFSKGNILI